MPRIQAPTVVEHRAMILARLVDAAEAILRDGRPRDLTATAVSTAAGIARNSIYRYVDSVEDLRALVVARYLPEWLRTVSAAVAAARTPQERIVTWVRANLEQAAGTGHGWMMEAGRTLPSPTHDPQVDQAHSDLRDGVGAAWRRLLEDAEAASVAGALTVAIVDAGFRQLDAGASADLVVPMSCEAANAVVEAFTRTGRP